MQILSFYLPFLLLNNFVVANPTILKIKNERSATIFVDGAVKNGNHFLATQKNKTSSSYQLFSHGRPGELLLNGKWCNAQEIATFLQPKLRKSQFAISNLNIYGCEFAKGTIGLQAVKYLENTLKISVSASTNITGKDGDWVLEVGKAEDVIALKNYNGNLQCAGVVGGTAPGDDFDGDGVCNVLDLDDDNDGILDAIEAPGCYYTSGEIAIPANVTTQIPTASSVSNLFDNDAATTFGFTSTLAANALNKTIVEITPIYPQAATAIVLNLGTTTSPIGAISAGATVKAQGWNGSAWVDLATYTASPDPSTYYQTFPFASNKTVYSKYRLFEAGVAGVAIGTNPVAEVTISVPATYVASANPKPTCNFDTDGDGFTNDKDLDSDNDGCPDAVEANVTNTAGVTTIAAPAGMGATTGLLKSIINGPYSGNGFADILQAAADTNSYKGVYTYKYAINSLISACTDTDGDGVPDIFDLDDDNDGILDVLECPNENKVTYSNFAGWTAGSLTGTVPYPGGGTVAINTAKAYTFNGSPVTYVSEGGGYPQAADGDALAAPYTGSNFQAQYAGYTTTPVATNALDIWKSQLFGVGTYVHDVEYDFTNAVGGGTTQNTIIGLGSTYPDATGWNTDIIIKAYKASDGSLETNYSNWLVLPSLVNATGSAADLFNTPWEAPQFTSGGIILDPVNNIAGYDGTQDMRYIQLQPSTTKYSKIVVERKLVTSAGGNNYDYESWAITLGYLNTNTCDLDGDGIPNSLDLDSDGDGCPDAIEGGAAFTNANLVASAMPGGNSGGGFTGVSPNPGPVVQNLGNTVGNTVTTMGVPTIATTGQTVGTSEDKTIKDPACCAAGYIAPAIAPTSISNTCPATSVNLAALTSSITTPTGSTKVWSLHNLPNNANDTLTTAQASAITAPGKYYSVFRNTASGCFSPLVDSVTVNIINCSAVPINLVSFNGVTNGCIAMLNWVIGTELNFNHFELEMSKDGVIFNKISTIVGTNAANGSSYVYQNLQNTNKAYYRLKQVDNDNRFEYSKTILLTTNCNKSSISIAPNPVQNELSITSSNAIKAISIYKADGRLMLIKGNYSSGQSLNVANFARGTYIMKIETINGDTERFKFIKE